MKFIPNSITRFGGRSLLKLNGASPTLLVVAGVVGLGATAVLAAKATRNIDPILEKHDKQRAELENIVYTEDRARQRDLLHLYLNTSVDLGKLYGPTILVGVSSAVAVLGGHKIIRGRQIAALSAYSGLAEQFNGYRKRVAATLGDDVERGIYEGARGEWVEDPNHPGEHILEPKFDMSDQDFYLRPWFDEQNVNWSRDATSNYLFLKGVQAHMNRMLEIRGYVFLNDVYDALRMDRTKEGQLCGWLYNRAESKDNYIDFGFMSSIDPQTVAFRNGVEKSVRLNFNIDGQILKHF